MREMSIDSIRVSLTNYQRVVILKDKDSDRYLPIWIGASEADAIAVKLQDMEVPRPLTHDLLDSIISSLGAQVSHILVSDLQDDTFYAKIVLEFEGGQTEIDSRPSDAIALAVRAKAPIYAADAIVERVGVQMEQESGKAVIPASGQSEDRELNEDELKRLSAFTDFIDSLDLENLGDEGDEPHAHSTR